MIFYGLSSDEPLLLYVDPAIYRGAVNVTVRYGYFYIGIADAVLGLPDWLKVPWLGYAMEKSNFTGMGSLVCHGEAPTATQGECRAAHGD